MHSGHRKTLHSAKHKNAKKSEIALRGSTSCAAALRRTVHRMRGVGQSLRDPHSLMIGGKVRGKLPWSDCGGVWQGGAEVASTRRPSPRVKLWLALCVGAGNVLSRREDDHLSLLSSELQRLNPGIAALSEVRRPVLERSWWVVTPTPGLGVLMVTMPKEFPKESWLADFLSCRSQRVALNGVLSSPLSVQAGVPQGSVLGPVLFLVYINDLSNSLENPLYLFADDSTLYCTVCHPSDWQAAASSVSADLDKITTW